MKIRILAFPLVLAFPLLRTALTPGARLAEAGGAFFVLRGCGELEAEDVLVGEGETFVLRGRQRDVALFQLDPYDARDGQQLARRRDEAGRLPLFADLERTA